MVKRGGTYVAVGYEAASQGRDAAVWTSSDGVEWTRVASATFGGPGDQQMNRVTWDGSRFDAVGYAGSEAALWRSSDGTTWSPVPPQASFQPPSGFMRMRGVAERNGTLVAVGYQSRGGINEPAAWVSSDGLTWQRVSDDPVFAASGSQLAAVSTGPDGFVVIGYDTVDGRQRAAAWTSPDGRTWLRAPAAQAAFDSRDPQEAFVVTFTGGQFVAGGTDGDRAAIWTSTDGQSWTESSDVAAFASASGSLAIQGLTTFDDGIAAAGWSQSNGQKDAALWRFGSP